VLAVKGTLTPRPSDAPLTTPLRVQRNEIATGGSGGMAKGGD